MANVKITGVKELVAKFQQIEKQMQGAILKNAALSGALVIQNSAIDKCPVDSGDLKQSIHNEISVSNATYAEIEVGTDVEYAAYVEFGTRFMAAQPYMRPAFDEESDNAVSEVGSALWAQLSGI